MKDDAIDPNKYDNLTYWQVREAIKRATLEEQVQDIQLLSEKYPEAFRIALNQAKNLKIRRHRR